MLGGDLEERLKKKRALPVVTVRVEQVAEHRRMSAHLTASESEDSEHVELRRVPANEGTLVRLQLRLRGGKALQQALQP